MAKALVFVLLASLCGSSQAGDSLRVVSGLYRAPAGRVQGLEVWIVDGAAIRRAVYPEFVYGGNEQRYRFVPRGELWIDQAVAAEEFNYTVAHEGRERALMAVKGMSYAEAHDSALSLERAMRLIDRLAARAHEASLGPVSPTDADGLKEIAGLPDSIHLHGVYRVLLEKRDSLEIWIVDGAVVRREIFPDFGFSGNDRAYRFIPEREIWIDAQVSCEETQFSVAAESAERVYLVRGDAYDEAYEKALSLVATLRRDATTSANARPPVSVPRPPDRDVGTGDEH